MRVASAQPASASGPHHPARLSADDLYKLAEWSRVRSSLQSRERVLEHRQKMANNNRKTARPTSAFQNFLLSQASTPIHSTPSGHALSDSVEIGVASHGFVTEVSVKLHTSPIIYPAYPYPIKSGDSAKHAVGNTNGKNTVDGSNKNDSDIGNMDDRLRSGSALTPFGSDRESRTDCQFQKRHYAGSRSLNVSRQCCEVLGPGVCRECQELRVRLMERERLEADFPRLHTSEHNVTTSAIAKRVLPGMSQADIEDKIARGQIARIGLHFSGRLHADGDSVHPGNEYEVDEPSDSRSSDNDRVNDVREKNGCTSRIEHTRPLSHPGRYMDDPADDEIYGRASPMKHEELHHHHNNNSNYRRHSEAITLRRPSNETNESNTATINTSDSASHTANNSSSSENLHSKPTNSSVVAKLKQVVGGEASTPLYFTDLRHMNSKIFQGRVARSLTPAKQRPDSDAGARATAQSGWRRLLPAGGDGSAQCRDAGTLKAFVSPRRVKLLESEPSYRGFFDPPLLARHLQQVANPSFFAGSNDPYSLPDARPESKY